MARGLLGFQRNHPPTPRAEARGYKNDIQPVHAGAPPVAVEIKAGSAPHLEMGFRTAFADLGCRRGYCIHGGADEYPLAQDVLAIPATGIRRIFESG